MANRKSTPKIVAHRGDSEHFPENTLAAFESAVKKGADIIELDVHQTKDKQIVVHHDFYLDRHTDGQGFIGNNTLIELKQLDAGSWHNSKHKGEKIPTLNEVFEIGKGNIRFEIEIKTPTKSFARSVIKLIEDNSLAQEVEITCQHRLLISPIKKFNPEIAIGLILYGFPDWMEDDLGIAQLLDYLQLADAQFAHLPIDLVRSNIVEAVRMRGFRVHIACNEHKEKLEHCFSLAPEKISTNYLDDALLLREKYWKQAKP